MNQPFPIYYDCSFALLSTIVGYPLFPLTILKWVVLIKYLPTPSPGSLKVLVYNVQRKGFLEKVASKVWPAVVKDYYNASPLLNNILQLLPVSSYLMSEKYQAKTLQVLFSMFGHHWQLRKASALFILCNIPLRPIRSVKHALIPMHQ